MEDITVKIELYHNLFLGCLVLAILCLILAGVLFVVLDIWNVLGYLTGRQKRKKVKEMESANALSGRLMSRERATMQYVAQEMKDDMGVRQNVKPGARKVAQVIVETPSDKEETQGTTTSVNVQQESYPVVEETAVLKETMIVNPDATATLDYSLVSQGKFIIEREIIFIHTQEVI